MGDLPDYVERSAPEEEALAEDSLFWLSGFLFPEVREPFWPQRQFSLLPNAELADDAAIEVQAMGLQYCVHVQQRREPSLRLTAPASWDHRQLLWADLPVFAEEPCEWHYPKLQVGYNIDQFEPPANLRPESNAPRRFGYLPNGDIVMHWALAEPLADRFDLDIEALQSSVDDHVLVSVQGVSEDALLETPIGQGGEVGIVLSRAETSQLPDALAYVSALGGESTVFDSSSTGAMFYRLQVPVIRCEWQLNRYVSSFWSGFDVEAPRLESYDFRIVDNPASREEPVFATENGNVVISDEFYEHLRGLLLKSGGQDAGSVLPIIRTP